MYVYYIMDGYKIQFICGKYSSYHTKIASYKTHRSKGIKGVIKFKNKNMPLNN